MPALTAALALLCQMVFAVPVAERMALERAQVLGPQSPTHSDHVDMGGMAAGMPGEPGKPTKPAHSKSDHQSCPFCATAALAALNAPARASHPVVALTDGMFSPQPAFFVPAHLDHAHLSRAPPALV